jgi:hypothetical protein
VKSVEGLLGEGLLAQSRFVPFPHRILNYLTLQQTNLHTVKTKFRLLCRPHRGDEKDLMRGGVAHMAPNFRPSMPSSSRHLLVTPVLTSLLVCLTNIIADVTFSWSLHPQRYFQNLLNILIKISFFKTIE